MRASMNVRRVACVRDPQTRAWAAASDGIPGLIARAPTFEKLVQQVMAIVPGLLEENALPVSGPRSSS